MAVTDGGGGHRRAAQTTLGQEGAQRVELVVQTTTTSRAPVR